MSISKWFKEFGKNTTLNVELQKYCERLKIDGVICMRDKLLSFPKFFQPLADTHAYLYERYNPLPLFVNLTPA